MTGYDPSKPFGRADNKKIIKNPNAIGSPNDSFWIEIIASFNGQLEHDYYSFITIE